MSVPPVTRQLRSLVSSAGRVELSLEQVPLAVPGENEITVRIEAAPVNPSDLALLLGPADPARFRVEGGRTVADLSPERIAAVAGRLDQSLPVGNEGAGTVVAAGARVQGMLGRTVSIAGGATYAEYRTLRAADALTLPDGASAADGASSFVNPMTVLGMIETMRMEGHTALVHTAGASNLGQMLVRACAADGIALVSIVRNPAGVALLRGLGARHVLDSSASDFAAALADALAETGATLAFDAIGGGDLAGRILLAMEAAASRDAPVYSRYGSTVHKQVYLYGRLDLRPTTLPAGAGMAWGVGGWLVTACLQRIGADASARLRARVAAELTTTFASRYADTVSLDDLLRPDVLAASAKRGTGAKILIDPSRPPRTP